ncbi:hypothetical protein G5B40_16575 [Pikeienuella piscinae]|uniref:Uncharacterized protein n=1 Tax=Pikeienuella piscinae TaxID=2748098 RepID=A0A7L5BWZ0_9RHOB|nr:hypothetical protein [Pikeienuella piscinae]QIE56910.1 hypothetical protein G5B40_16575 [Pikeienuella piscinae]
MRAPDPALTAFIADELARPTLPEAGAFAAHLAERPGTAAVLFYGSCLQRGTTEGVLDFYVLTDGGDWGQGALAAAAGRVLPPNVYVVAWKGLRAKVAVTRLADFGARCGLETLDTTFWARFCQRAAIVWARNDEAERAAAEAVATSVETAAIWAARLAPGLQGAAAWRALFARTYRVEIRPERKGRGDAIVDADEARFARLWALTSPARSVAPPASANAWRARWWVGKPLHLGRLAKGAFTYEGGVRYLIWKIRRHRRDPSRQTR